MPSTRNSPNMGFTLIELLVVIAIIGSLAAMVLVSLRSAREAAVVVQAGAIQREMTVAVELYFDQMGFYPPDVNRGWDPGLVRTLPWNADEEAGEPPTGAYASPGTDCSHCPSDWETIVQERWNGPYIPAWPRFTPWRGKYDYNYWGSEATRAGGCVVPPGIYIGVQGDYAGANNIPSSAEVEMVGKGFDYDGCINGEAQLLLWRL